MSLASIRTVASPATAILHLSRERPGISGSAQLPSGEPVPIANLLARVLAQYGLPESASQQCKSENRQSRERQLDLWA